MHNKSKNIFESKHEGKSETKLSNNSVLENMINSLLNEGLQLHHIGQLTKAKTVYEQILKLDPKNFNSIQLLGVIATQTKNWLTALDLYRLALEIDPTNPVVFCNQGIVFQELQRLDEALSSYERAIEFKGDYAEAHYGRGVTLRQLKRLNEALLSYERAIEYKSDFGDAYFNRGVVLFELQYFEDALINYIRAVKFKSDSPDIFYNIGILLNQLKRNEEALKSYDQSIRLNGQSSKTYYNRGLVLSEMKRFEEALRSYDNAIMLNGWNAEAYSNRGNVLKELNRIDEAFASYDRAIAIRCDYTDAYYNQAVLLNILKFFKEAQLTYKKVAILDPDYSFLMGLKIGVDMQLCDWKDFDDSIKTLIFKINAEKKVSPSFNVLSLFDKPLIHRKTSEIWNAEKHPPNLCIGSISKSKSKNKIKIGYYSADFREHPVAYLTAELFELHDKNFFEIYAFYFGPDEESVLQNRISLAVNRFINVSSSSDMEIAIISRQLGIDIAVDLSGHTQGGRSGIFSYRAAPIQLSYIGYLGTMGAEYYDYLIGDKVIIPETSQKYYTEKILYLPSYQVNDSNRQISDKVFTRTDFNLPPSGFVFCCFNQNYKITPATFDVWMDILKASSGSVLFLYANNLTAENNLRAEAEKRGVNQTRLFFGTTLQREEYLARYRVADLFLDTLPYNSGTTASDALWTGLPVLTCMGESFASRIAGSLLTAIDLPELITENYEEYKNLAIELATNQSKLEALKAKLKRNLKTTALFDTPRFTKSLETAYIKIYDRYQSDLSPDHIYS